MNSRKFIREFLNFYLEGRIIQEKKKRKKKNKKPYVSTQLMDTPTGSIFYMDAAISENLKLRKFIRNILEELLNKKSPNLISESVAVKVLPNTFNHLKWKLNETQKYFLDDFIDIHPNYLKESDYEYASKKTGIPTANIKSIQNTYGSWNKKEIIQDNDYGRFKLGSGKAITANEYDFVPKYRNDTINFKTISKDEADALRYPKKSLKQKEYESKLSRSIGGNIKKSNTLKEENYDSWAMYYIIGKLQPKDARLNERRIMEIDFEPSEDYYNFEKSMLNSNKKSNYWIKVEALINEFNKVFGTAYKIVEQYDLTKSKSNCIRIVVEEINLESKMVWDEENKKYINWNQAPEFLKQQYIKNRPEGMTKEIPNVNFDDLMNKYLNFDQSMFKGL